MQKYISSLFKDKKDSCIVALSGGQDSATCLALSTFFFDNIFTISFNYGQRHASRELFCANVLSHKANADHFVIPISSFHALSTSALTKTEDKADISANHPRNENLPASFVPGRNFIFLGLVAAKAFELGVKNIVIGACQTDFSGYPDCRQKSIDAVGTALFLCLDFDIQIHTPLMYITKKETVLLMKELGMLDWYADTHTCYNNEYPPCGHCPACLLRQKGFDEAGIPDPLTQSQ